MTPFKKLLAWAGKHERHLGAALFVGGFVGDLITFAILDISFVNLAFLVYLSLALVGTLGSHALLARDDIQHTWVRAGRILFPLLVQYAVGSLLSGCLIFYTKSAVLSVSWPFLVVLVAVFFGNEYFRKYKDRLVFQTVLLFFTLYAYIIFALPLLVNRLGTGIFYASTALTLVLFALILWMLDKLGRHRLRESLKRIVGFCIGVVIVVVASYETGILPPLPLGLREAGIYHQIERTSQGYVVSAEAERPWYQLFIPPVLHILPGQTLYTFSSVFAPISFSAGVVHHWEYLDTETNKWSSRAHIAFPISGGRSNGYRGYSQLSNLEAGQWRVSIETPEGRVIGRERFSVEFVAEPVELQTEVR